MTDQVYKKFNINDKYIICVCASVRAYVRACVRHECLRACMCRLTYDRSGLQEIQYTLTSIL